MPSFITHPSVLVVALIVLWTLPWKGVALWKAARKNDQWWFIALLIINTLAALEILYIFIFSERKSLNQPKDGTPTA
ncbi:MAG: hypothetical protein KGI60_00555 [Patescibacteria group bacterium]|nr:hypothetical protein [Patescibacteria group bacterium]